MRNKPIIGISGSMIIDNGGNFPGYRRSYVNDDYIISVIEAGGTPFIIPMNTNEENIKAQLELVDGLILSGGHDVDPLLFGEEPHQKLGETLPERDVFDLNLIKYAKEFKIPTLGICRGHQILNVANGGTLHQDLSLIDGCYIKHNQQKLPHQGTHTTKVEKNSTLNTILGDEVMTNSFHHIAVNKVASGFKAVAFAKDGVIEAIESLETPFRLGVQWHPEMMSKTSDKMFDLFKYFINKCTIEK